MSSSPANPPSRMDCDRNEVAASDRFVIEKRLGTGGMGVVYQAFDRDRNKVVALKTLLQFSAATLYRLKHEFRALADVVHPNLVQLYELISVEDHWYLTMEVVDGVDFVAYVRQGKSAPTTASTEQDHAAFDTVTSSTKPVAELICSPDSPDVSVLDESRMRSALRQLAEGVVALHEAGQLHRDIKPSNVLVTKQGRVVLLDFGLAADLDPSGLHHSTEHQIAGTVAYMSPEQAAGRELSSASDWYSVGVMMYEALTGRRPFTGTFLEVLRAKQESAPAAPNEIVPDAPVDLSELCAELLQRKPESRPSGQDVLRRIGASADSTSAFEIARSRASTRPALVGRQKHLALLAEAFAAMKQGQSATVLVHGESGVGKSALVMRFLGDLQEAEDAVILAGRCYERESLPFKAFDSVVDALCRYLRKLTRSDVLALMPRDIYALSRVFPVLQRVRAISDAPQRVIETPDRQELRRRAFGGLRELLGRLGDRRPVVLCIDDLQWGDVDSAALISEVLRPPDAPRLLLVGCYRNEAAGTNLSLRALLEALDQIGVVRRELAVEALTREESQELAVALLGPAPGDAANHAAVIAQQSGGNPFFVNELVRYARTRETSSRRDSPDEMLLDDMLWSRITQLPPDAHRLLELVAVAGQPIQQADAHRAAGLAGNVRTELELLRSGHLVRTSGPSDHDEIETYHDRIREAVLTRVPLGRLKDYHRCLATTLEGTGRANPEVVAAHFQAAGEMDKAAKYYGEAASAAAESLAFERAAKLYRLALQFQAETDDVVQDWRIKLGDALANAGRGPEAAQEYLAAARRAASADALELRRRAAMQSLISGHVDGGLAAVRIVLDGVGTRLAKTPARALICYLLRAFQLRVRGLSFHERPAREVPADILTQIDVFWSVAVGLSMVDPIRSMHFQKRNLLLALKAGEPYRVARALSLEVFHSATAGARAKRRTAQLLEAAGLLAQRIGHGHTLGLVSLVTGIAAFGEGRWKMAREACERAEQILRDRCTGVAWEVNTAQAFWIWSVWWMGRLGELIGRVPSLQKEAQERGNLYFAMTSLSTAQTLSLLAADDPVYAQQQLRDFKVADARHAYYLQDYIGLIGQMYVDLYVGDGAAAWNHHEQHGKALAGSLLLRIQQIRIHLTHMRLLSALAACRHTANSAALLGHAEQAAREIDRENVPWSKPLAQLGRAAIATLRGDHPLGISLLQAAAEGFDANDMSLCAAAARRRRGELLGGDEGQSLVDAANAWMIDQGIRNSSRMAAMMAPGFPGS